VASTPAVTAPPAAAKPPVPAAAEKPGRHLIGKLEGPTIITDASQLPKAFKEAPMLSELVKAGKLPPVEERLPQEPLVLKSPDGVRNRAHTNRSVPCSSPPSAGCLVPHRRDPDEFPSSCLAHAQAA
jgi:hypothetical protein